MKLIEKLEPYHVDKDGIRRYYYFGIFECPYCGNLFKTRLADAKIHPDKSCGCMGSRATFGDRRKTHGMCYTNIYHVWEAMKRRCYLKTDKGYNRYGGRGITVCNEWLTDVSVFILWAKESGYDDGLVLDRINCDGNYSPENCRWVTPEASAQNRDMQRLNRLGYTGVSYINSRYKARITVDYHTIDLGYFNTAKEAAEAYNKYVLENHTYHRLNVIQD